MPYYNRDLKRDHNFDNHPHVCFGSAAFMLSLDPCDVLKVVDRLLAKEGIVCATWCEMRHVASRGITCSQALNPKTNMPSLEFAPKLRKDLLDNHGCSTLMLAAQSGSAETTLG